MATAIETRTAIPPLSQSRYELMACAFLYATRVIEGTREAPNPYAERGSKIHRVLASYVAHLVETRQQTDYAKFDELLNGLDGEVREVLEAVKERMVIDPEKVLGTEMYLAIDEGFRPLEFNEDRSDWRGAGDPAYEGTPDLIILPDATTAEIHDYKSFYRIENADSFQAKFYPLLVFQHFSHVQKVRFVLDFVRYGAQRSVEFTRHDDLPKLKAMAKVARVRQMELHADTEAIEAMPGQHCCWCPLLLPSLQVVKNKVIGAEQVCPIAAINPYTNQEPEDRVRFAVWLNAAKKQNDAILKDHVNANGSVSCEDANGVTYQAGFHLQERTSYPASCLPIVSANDPALVEKLTISGLSTLLRAKKRAALKELLAAQAVKTPITKFGITGMPEDSEE